MVAEGAGVDATVDVAAVLIGNDTIEEHDD